MGITNFLVARPQPKQPEDREAGGERIVPARNEAGNIRRIFEETPSLGAGTELIFVEGHSHDNTYETIEREIECRRNGARNFSAKLARGKETRSGWGLPRRPANCS